MQSDFKVVVVGGGVGGLCAALSLAKANIDYVLLERNSEFFPNFGASIAMNVNGLRILDQLGVVDTLSTLCEPVKKAILHRSDASVLVEITIFETLAQRYGYKFTFTKRQTLLQVMYDAVPDKSKLLCNKKVQCIEESETGVKVTTTDGSEYNGSIVIGADGVHSVVRKHMFDALAATIDISKDREELSVTYSCIYGISDPVKGLAEGDNHMVYRPGSSFLVAAGKDGIVYWFFFQKLDKTYRGNEFPRYTQQDADDTASHFADAKITSIVTFGEIYKRRQAAIKVPLEEGVFKHWHQGRKVLIGDAVHKMTPNFGQGGNSAIEGVAVLVNELHKLLKNHSQPTQQQLGQAFCDYKDKHEKRAMKIFNEAKATTRLQALDGFFYKLIALYGPRLVGESFILKRMCSILDDSPTLDFIPKL